MNWKTANLNISRRFRRKNRRPINWNQIRNQSPTPTIRELNEEDRQLLKRLSELDPGTDEDWTQWKHDSDCWQGGFDAGNAGEEVGVCIYTPGDKQDDWLRGWCAANSEWEEEEIEGDEEGESQPSDEAPIDRAPVVATVTTELDEL